MFRTEIINVKKDNIEIKVYDGDILFAEGYFEKQEGGKYFYFSTMLDSKESEDQCIDFFIPDEELKEVIKNRCPICRQKQDDDGRCGCVNKDAWG